jgi:hypothetical protein
MLASKYIRTSASTLAVESTRPPASAAASSALIILSWSMYILMPSTDSPAAPITGTDISAAITAMLPCRPSGRRTFRREAKHDLNTRAILAISRLSGNIGALIGLKIHLPNH